MELHPSFSPDGTRVAYSWGEQDGRTFSVYVKLIGAGDPVVLAKDVGENPSPAWSPDGRWIAVLKDLGCQASLLLIPASGGQSSELTRLNKAPPNIKNCVPPAALYPGSWLTWSADSKYLFTSAKNKAEATFQIVRISVASGQQQPITFPGPELASGGLGSGDTGPAVSPDGRSLAFVRASGLWNSDIYVATLPTSNGMAGEPRRVTSHNADLRTPAWTEDGEDLIFSSNRGGRRRLWRVSASGSAEAVPVVGLGENATDVTIPPGGGHLVYGRANAQGSLWRFPIDGTKAGKPERIAETAARITHPHHSPDSARIVFQSGRSSVYEIWKCDSNGANMVQLTNFGKGAAGSPRWSPDGETIAFDANVDGHWEIYAIRSEGGRPVRLTTGKGNVVPNWSADGSWIYYTATEGTSNVWKVRPDGSTITQVTKDGGMFATESPDGRYLYYMKMVSNTGEIWRTPVDSPSPSKVLSDARGRLFTVTARGIYFMAGSDIPELRFFDLESQSTRVVNTSIGSPFVAVTTDGKWAVYSRNENSGSNLMVVENFK
jgi:Tol biopolymer transport system component